jgi:hypothetical protein
MKRTIPQAFDEWMRRYIEEPERFAREFQAVQEFVAQDGTDGRETTYGADCAAFLEQLMRGG